MIDQVRVQVRIRGARRLFLACRFWMLLRRARLITVESLAAHVNAALTRTDVQVRAGGKWLSLGRAQLQADIVDGPPA